MAPTHTPEQAAKEALLAEVSDRASELAERWGATAEQAAEFLAHYFRHVDDRELLKVDADTLLARVAAHLELARSRPPGTTNLQVWWPHTETDGWNNPSPIIQIVHDDLPFLVDTVSIEVLRQGWQLREIIHPQFVVRRNAVGDLLEIVRTDRAGEPDAYGESWIHVEAIPPLGAGPAAYAEMERGLHEVLRLVEVAVADWPPIRARLADTIHLLQEEPVPYTFAQVRSAMELLQWLDHDHFTFMGYREYRLVAETRDDERPPDASREQRMRFEPVPGTGLGMLRGDEEPPDAFQGLPSTTRKPALVLVTKDNTRSRIHRSADLDYIGVRLFDGSGAVVGERRFLGLFSATAYTDSVTSIPGLKDKAEEILQHSGYGLDSHGAKAIQATIEGYPRDELFQTRGEDLAPLISQISRLRERRQVRLFLRPDFYQRFVSCLVFLPRDRYVTNVRTAIERILLDRLGGDSLTFSARANESVLARLHFVVRLRPGAKPPEVNARELEAELAEVARSWEDRFASLIAEDPDQAVLAPFAAALSEGYKEDSKPRHAILDLIELQALKQDSDMRLVLFIPDDAGDRADLRLKMFRKNTSVSLSDVLPHLTLLGVKVIDERPYEFDLPGIGQAAIYDLGLQIRGGRDRIPDWTPAVRSRFNEAFRASFTGRAEADRLNGLVTAAGLSWHEVTWLRLIARYLQQVGASWTQDSIAQALLDEVEITRRLMRLFRAKFDPDAVHGGTPAARSDILAEHTAGIISSLDEVTSLEHDRIIRAFLAVINATVRTNAFAEHGALAVKLLPQELSWIPEPRPAYEIFVCSPILEGVHLRFGHVARGGLRWSDRRDDFRTEVLGLVKAQMVKNTVIVPVGAKGGFCPKVLPDIGRGRRAYQEAGRACYQVFINALLDVTDNLVEGEVVPPDQVLRYDGDDPYLVVAADKGTATFSDTANEIAIRRGFWLGDAFASGGSAGYDHKGMGITARGAWVSVERHFRDLGRNPQTEDFTCVGIGDMSGDVFGNGMLLSHHIKLVAAFNHLQVFLDPDPDPESTWAERKRLFDAGKGWDDYDTGLISAGGGIYPRTAKSVPVSEQVRKALRLDPEITTLTPAELISAILRAPVDLLWNGGIGTYVRASEESDAEVGDKANDVLRVTGAELRCLAVGEGGNLGFTQRGRIEYARKGGRINTDFIDNSAGVDTSDHEVNIKILLSDEVRSGRLSVADRNELLEAMTDDVASHVLAHNYDQNLALANAEAQAVSMGGSHERWMQQLTAVGLLDRNLEELPTSEQMTERIAHGQGLCGPELATLLSYTKIWLENQVLATDLPDDPYLADRLTQYFPALLRERYGEAMRRHRLHREIITTVATNRFVNSAGVTACFRLCGETGAGVPDVMRAQLAARSIFRVAEHEKESAALDNLVDAAVQTRIRLDLRDLVERSTRWLLRHRRAPLDVQATIDEFVDEVQEVKQHLGEWLGSHEAEELAQRTESYAAAGIPENLARVAAETPFLPQALPIVQTAHQTDRDVGLVTRVTTALTEDLRLDTLQDAVSRLPRQNRWDYLARAALRDDLLQTRADLTAQALAAAPDAEYPTAILRIWRKTIPGLSDTQRTLTGVCDGDPDIARLSVGLRAVRSLLTTPL